MFYKSKAFQTIPDVSSSTEVRFRFHSEQSREALRIQPSTISSSSSSFVTRSKNIQQEWAVFFLPGVPGAVVKKNMLVLMP